jgi:hypothetical protein
MLILIENPTSIHNQLAHVFEAADCFVFCPLEEEPHKVIVVRFRYEITTGSVEPDEPLLMEQGSEDFFVTIIPGDNRHFQDARQSRWRIRTVK